jgi:D-alanyl-D-alanine carboxypeptidase
MRIDEISSGTADGGNSRPSRRTVLVGAAGALAAAGLSTSATAGAITSTVSNRSARHFDPVLAAQLQKVLREALRAPGIRAPGAILHVESPTLGTWSGAAGLGRVRPRQPMVPSDGFRAGSIIKPFVASVVLQLAERNHLSLDAALPQVLPPDVTGRFPDSADITVRMLLGHRSGLPEWDTPLMDIVIGHHPGKVWTIAEKLDIAAAQPQVFPPGSSYSYCNTEYNLLGLIIEHATGRTWRQAVTRGVIEPLGLSDTHLPPPGRTTITGPHAHGYGDVDGVRVDWTGVDPSMAGAAGGGALVTTAHDLARFVDALLAGRLFQRSQTLTEMLTFAPAPGEGGQVGYGLGIEQRVGPGDVELIGHLGGTAGYVSYVGRLRQLGATMAFALNYLTDPTPLFLPAVDALVAAHK